MKKKDNLQTISTLRLRCGETQFRVAIQHLFDTGHQSFNEKNVAETKIEIQRDTLPNAIMTADFQCALLDCCLTLSKLPIWDILLYVKLYLSMDGDDSLLYEEAERVLRTWDFTPQVLRDAYADPDKRSEIVQQLVEQHTDRFSDEEIKSAVRCVVDSQ